MSETEVFDQNEQQKPMKSSFSSCTFSFFFTLFPSSLNIFFQNKQILLSILILLTLPLSVLLFSFSFSSRPHKRHIYHLESVALFTSTNFESRHLLKESRDESISLLRLKLIYSIPSSILSLLAFVSTVHVSSLSPPHRPSFFSAVTAIKLAWKRVAVTSLCCYVLFFFYVQLPQLFAAALMNYPRVSLPILVIGSGFEIYLMGLLSLGMVVSALEEKFGWDAIRVGSDLMTGRRVCLWFVTCMFVGVSGLIGNRFEKLTDGEDYVKFGVCTALMRWETVGLLCFYAVLVIWSFIVTTLFYCDCKNLFGTGVNHKPRITDTV